MIAFNKAVDKIATAGLFIAAFFSPCCFPLYGFILSTWNVWFTCSNYT